MKCSHTSKDHLDSNPNCSKCIEECVEILQHLDKGRSPHLSDIDYYLDCIKPARAVLNSRENSIKQNSPEGYL